MWKHLPLNLLPAAQPWPWVVLHFYTPLSCSLLFLAVYTPCTLISSGPHRWFVCATCPLGLITIPTSTPCVLFRMTRSPLLLWGHESIGAQLAIGAFKPSGHLRHTPCPVGLDYMWQSTKDCTSCPCPIHFKYTLHMLHIHSKFISSSMHVHFIYALHVQHMHFICARCTLYIIYEVYKGV